MQFNLPKHIVEHAILGITKNGGTGPGTRPPENVVLRTSDVTPVVSQLEYNITDNANGTLSKPFSTSNIMTTAVEITDLNYKPAYDSGNVFTRTRVTGTVDGTGKVTLNVVPYTDFIIHYIYHLDSDTYVSNYTPNDVVTKIESEFFTTQIAKKVAYDHTVKNYFTQTNVQDVIDKISEVLMEKALDQARFNEQPVESPNGARTTFTIPNGEAIKNTHLHVFVGPVKYLSENIEIISAGTQFRIINGDYVPKSDDDLRISYVRRITV